MGKPTRPAALLESLKQHVKREITSTPAVQKREGRFSVNTLPITSRTWHQISDVVAVVVDLKNSTKLSTNKWAQSTASLYEASTGGVIRILKNSSANFIAIQGDGAFALYWGERRYERAMCAAITTRRFGIDLVAQLRDRWPEQPKTGLKIGVASGRVLAKRVGIPRNPGAQEPVWAGKAVNYATKAAQSATGPSILITARVWQAIASNDYLAKACACSRRADPNIWTEVSIRRLPDGDAQAAGRKSTYSWCSRHIDETCEAVLAGKKKRLAPTPRTTSVKSASKVPSAAGARPSTAEGRIAPRTGKSFSTAANRAIRKPAEVEGVAKNPARKPSAAKSKQAGR